MLKRSSQELVFKALAHEKRRKILDYLRNHPRTTGQVCRHVKELDRCTVMLHLDVLEKADLIIVQRKGRERWNYINVFPIKAIYDRWISRYASHSIELLARLKADLEKGSRKRS